MEDPKEQQLEASAAWKDHQVNFRICIVPKHIKRIKFGNIYIQFWSVVVYWSGSHFIHMNTRTNTAGSKELYVWIFDFNPLRESQFGSSHTDSPKSNSTCCSSFDYHRGSCTFINSQLMKTILNSSELLRTAAETSVVTYFYHSPRHLPGVVYLAPKKDHSCPIWLEIKTQKNIFIKNLKQILSGLKSSNLSHVCPQYVVVWEEFLVSGNLQSISSGEVKTMLV